MSNSQYKMILLKTVGRELCEFVAFSGFSFERNKDMKSKKGNPSYSTIIPANVRQRQL